jgi:thiosulfate dehydrogenase (quinone) large subunit
MTGRVRADGAARALPRTHPARWMWLAPPPSAQHLAGWALLPLRAFLGVTFCFAGLQKLANPAFFDANNTASIQAQMAGAARHSPISGLISPLSHRAVLLGVVIAIAEIAVGVGALLGLLTRVAAAGGLVISLSLFLAVSFHTNPYYTGSDIVFTFAWLPLLLAGGGQFSLDTLGASLVAVRHTRPASVPVHVPFATVQKVCGSYENGACAARRNMVCEPSPCPYLERQHAQAPARPSSAPVDVERRRLVGALAVGAGAVAVVGAGVAAGLGRLLHTASASATTALNTPPPARTPVASASAPASSATAASSAPASASISSATASATPSAKPSPTHTTPPATTRPSPTPSAAPKPPGTRIGPASSVPIKGAATFRDPASGDPAIVVQPRAGTFLAFDAVCPHAGCTVDYDSRNTSFICPCHGSQFNGTTGAVEVGPARQGLAKIAIAEGSDGQLYAR